MTRYALLAILSLPLPAATITLTQSAAYQFTSPAWATNPPERLGGITPAYDADLAVLSLANTYGLSFVVTGNGVNDGIVPAACCEPGTAILRAALPLVAGAAYVLTINDFNPGIPVALGFNDAYFGAVPVDPPVGGTAVPEPGFVWLVGLGLLIGLVALRRHNSKLG